MNLSGHTAETEKRLILLDFATGEGFAKSRVLHSKGKCETKILPENPYFTTEFSNAVWDCSKSVVSDFFNCMSYTRFISLFATLP